MLLGTLGSFEGFVSDRVLYTLILGVVTSVCNLLIIEPRATSVLFERYHLENSGSPDADARKKLTKKFGALMLASKESPSCCHVQRLCRLA